MNILVFAGTTEGRLFTDLASAHNTVIVCVATEYGKKDLLSDSSLPQDKCLIHTGRLDKKNMICLMRNTAQSQQSCFDAVVDATHPYAVEVTKNIRAAASECRVPYYRLLRSEEHISVSDTLCFSEYDSVEEAAKAVASDMKKNDKKNMSAHISSPHFCNVFVSTGSRELSCFKYIPGFPDTVYVRVIPSQESIEKCIAAGIKEDHILAALGPFSEETNIESFKKYAIRYLITKESGKEGGYGEKLSAASQCAVAVYAVRRPKEEHGENVFKSAKKLCDFLDEKENKHYTIN